MTPDAEDFDKNDVVMASILMGGFLGFGYFATYHTILETRRCSRFATHVILCWGEIFANLVIALLAYLHIVGVLQSSVGLYFGIVSAWTLQVHCLLQIIVSRISVLVPPAKGRRLKLSVAILWTFMCITVFCVWIPAKLEVSQRFETVNFYWEYVDKCTYLITDASLNFTFIYTVKTRLVKHGLTKYDRLVRFNQSIVIISLSADLLIIGLMSLPNHFMYTQFCTLAFIIKLDIEIAMFGLIAKVAQSTGLTEESAFRLTSFTTEATDNSQTRRMVFRNQAQSTLYECDVSPA